MVKHLIHIALFLFLIIPIQSCSKKKKAQIFEGEERIVITYNPDKYTTIESFVSEIKIVPLETNDDCLTGRIIHQVKVHKDLIYINSDQRDVLVFDMSGKFIRKIGKRGQGPGEFLEARDFIFTNDETIEILDYKKIEKYTLDGKPLGTSKQFDFLGLNPHCNPNIFCRSFSSGYYFWEGISGPLRNDERLREKSSLMYRVNNDMKIDGAYFDTKYGDGTTRDRFRYYQDKIYVIPSWLDYNIYQIHSNDSISIRYSFDFGKYGFDSNQDVDRKTIAHEQYITGIEHFNETDRFLNFSFLCKNIAHNMVYSKVTGQSYILTLLPKHNENEFRFWYTQTVHEDWLIALIDVSFLRYDFERMTEEKIRKWGLEGFDKLDDEDNSVLVFYKINI